MPIFRFNKLVRDKIPELNRQQGIKTNVKQLTGQAKVDALLGKLLEEAEELKYAQGEDKAKEIGDVRDVLDAIIAELQLSEEDIQQHRKERDTKAGGFANGQYVSTVVVPDDYTGPWLEYFRSNPDRFPEVTEE
jgi:predicted house-cleaning noncanonical NTP pyrophosphatase (MazG superfamily)